MRAVIISAGTIADYDYIKKLINNDDYIICADGGFSHCLKMGIKPHFLVGDFDSFNGELPCDVETLRLQPEKDYSDTHVAVSLALERGYDELLLLGCTGSRLDHTLSNIGLLEDLRRMGKRAFLVDRCNLMYAAEKHQFIHAAPGTAVSFIPLQPVKTLKGFKYPLDNADIDMYRSIWLSNVLEAKVGEVSFDSGVLVVDVYNEEQ